MNPIPKPGNEPDQDDMSTDFDPDAETGTPATAPGQEEADAIGDFA